MYKRSESNSESQIIETTTIIGSASIVVIVIGLAKVKLLALLFGPSGIGLMGILLTIMSTGTTLFGLGVTTSGVRSIAKNIENCNNVAIVRISLLTLNIFLGLIALITIITYKKELSELFFKTTNYDISITVIAIGVFFSLVSGSQTTLLQGLRKIADLAKVKVFSALVSLIIGMLLIITLKENGIAPFVITMPFVTSFIALYYCKKLSKIKLSSFKYKIIWTETYSLITLGFVFMVTGLMAVFSQLIVRYIINDQLNLESVGYFQASWSISMTYIGFVLSAMAADYYPRLTQQIGNQSIANKLVNDQTKISIILAAPILIGMLVFAPEIIAVLYSADFVSSVNILRWQVFGDVLKIISWPLGFILLSKGCSKLYFCCEFVWNISYLVIVYYGIEYFGINIAGYAFVSSYLIYLIIVYCVCSRVNDFKWTDSNVRLIIIISTCCGGMLGLSYLSKTLTFVIGFILLVVFSFHTFKIISKVEYINIKIQKIYTFVKNILHILGVKK
ncbi:MAG: O-antigen translocase [Oceanospirillaceae bacterium]|nr:O-antigen translocase [Oceanospirillaceae bacterium]